MFVPVEQVPLEQHEPGQHLFESSSREALGPSLVYVLFVVHVIICDDSTVLILQEGVHGYVMPSACEQ